MNQFERPLHCGIYCIPMCHESLVERLKDESSDVSRKILCSTGTNCILCMCYDRCFLAYSYTLVVMLALTHGISLLLAQIFFTSIGVIKILHIVSKRSKFFRQSSSSNCSLVGASSRIISLK